MDEKTAIARLKQGDIGGLEGLVGLYYLAAVRWAYLVTHERMTAEDVVQSAFLRVYERFEQFDEARPFVPWFRRIVINNAIRAASRQKQPFEVSLDYNAWLENESPLVIEQTEAMDWLNEIETRHEVWQALERLTALQRAAIVLHYYVGLSVVEAAVEMGCASGTVKAHLFVARQRLRDLLANEYSPVDRSDRG